MVRSPNGKGSNTWNGVKLRLTVIQTMNNRALSIKKAVEPKVSVSLSEILVK